MAGIQLEIYFRRVIAAAHICQKSNEQSVDRASESDFHMTSNFTLRQCTFVSRLLKTSDDTHACAWEKGDLHESVTEVQLVSLSTE
ncbi:hypothetical protein CEXT_377161 [Caerostris extrusa]|uniref:Uncharacterized protein n=1 Tax=Caerostris extrusa TaxID=172846 RepID=A0AAV4W0U3_CAEEX|nr:hypothetical protein CEXT_377161 [Caerostris extrusa]